MTYEGEAMCISLRGAYAFDVRPTSPLSPSLNEMKCFSQKQRLSVIKLMCCDTAHTNFIQQENPHCFPSCWFLKSL